MAAERIEKLTDSMIDHSERRTNENAVFSRAFYAAIEPFSSLGEAEYLLSGLTKFTTDLSKNHLRWHRDKCTFHSLPPFPMADRHTPTTSEFETLQGLEPLTSDDSSPSFRERVTTVVRNTLVRSFRSPQRRRQSSRLPVAAEIVEPKLMMSGVNGSPTALQDALDQKEAERTDTYFDILATNGAQITLRLHSPNDSTTLTGHWGTLATIAHPGGTGPDGQDVTVTLGNFHGTNWHALKAEHNGQLLYYQSIPRFGSESATTVGNHSRLSGLTPITSATDLTPTNIRPAPTGLNLPDPSLNVTMSAGQFHFRIQTPHGTYLQAVKAPIEGHSQKANLFLHKLTVDPNTFEATVTIPVADFPQAYNGVWLLDANGTAIDYVYVNGYAGRINDQVDGNATPTLTDEEYQAIVTAFTATNTALQPEATSSALTTALAPANLPAVITPEAPATSITATIDLSDPNQVTRQNGTVTLGRQLTLSGNGTADLSLPDLAPGETLTVTVNMHTGSNDRVIISPFADVGAFQNVPHFDIFNSNATSYQCTLTIDSDGNGSMSMAGGHNQTIALNHLDLTRDTLTLYSWKGTTVTDAAYTVAGITPTVAPATTTAFTETVTQTLVDALPAHLEPINRTVHPLSSDHTVNADSVLHTTGIAHFTHHDALHLQLQNPDGSQTLRFMLNFLETTRDYQVEVYDNDTLIQSHPVSFDLNTDITYSLATDGDTATLILTDATGHRADTVTATVPTTLGTTLNASLHNHHEQQVYYNYYGDRDKYEDRGHLRLSDIEAHHILLDQGDTLANTPLDVLLTLTPDTAVARKLDEVAAAAQAVQVRAQALTQLDLSTLSASDLQFAYDQLQLEQTFYDQQQADLQTLMDAVLQHAESDDIVVNCLESINTYQGQYIDIPLETLGGTARLRNWQGQNSSATLTMEDGHTDFVGTGEVLTLDLSAADSFTDGVSFLLSSSTNDDLTVTFYRNENLLGTQTVASGSTVNFADTDGLTSVVITSAASDPAATITIDTLNIQGTMNREQLTSYELDPVQHGPLGAVVAPQWYSNAAEKESLGYLQDGDTEYWRAPSPRPGEYLVLRHHDGNTNVNPSLFYLNDSDQLVPVPAEFARYQVDVGFIISPEAPRAMFWTLPVIKQSVGTGGQSHFDHISAKSYDEVAPNYSSVKLRLAMGSRAAYGRAIPTGVLSEEFQLNDTKRVAGSFIGIASITNEAIADGLVDIVVSTGTDGNYQEVTRYQDLHIAGYSTTYINIPIQCPGDADNLGKYRIDAIINGQTVNIGAGGFVDFNNSKGVIGGGGGSGSGGTRLTASDSDEATGFVNSVTHYTNSVHDALDNGYGAGTYEMLRGLPQELRQSVLFEIGKTGRERLDAQLGDSGRSLVDLVEPGKQQAEDFHKLPTEDQVAYLFTLPDSLRALAWDGAAPEVRRAFNQESINRAVQAGVSPVVRALAELSTLETNADGAIQDVRGRYLRQREDGGHDVVEVNEAGEHVMIAGEDNAQRAEALQKRASDIGRRTVLLSAAPEVELALALGITTPKEANTTGTHNFLAVPSRDPFAFKVPISVKAAGTYTLSINTDSRDPWHLLNNPASVDGVFVDAAPVNGGDGNYVIENIPLTTETRSITLNGVLPPDDEVDRNFVTFDLVDQGTGAKERAFETFWYRENGSQRLVALDDALNEESVEALEDKTTWVVIHGRDSGPTANGRPNNISRLHNALKQGAPGDQIVAVDWSEYADATLGLQLPLIGDLPIFTDDGRALSGVDFAPLIGEFVATRLAEFGVSPSNIHIVGHSWGTLVGYEAANYLKLRSGESAKSMVVLDTATDFDKTEGFRDGIRETLRLTNAYQTNDVDFRDVSQYSLSFEGSDSGQEERAVRATDSVKVVATDKSFLGTLLPPIGEYADNHGTVIEVFRHLISDDTTAVSREFGAELIRDGKSPTMGWRKDTYDKHDGDGFEAVVVARGIEANTVASSLYYTDDETGHHVRVHVEDGTTLLDNESGQHGSHVLTTELSFGGWIGLYDRHDRYAFTVAEDMQVTLSGNMAQLQALDGATLHPDVMNFNSYSLKAGEQYYLAISAESEFGVALDQEYLVTVRKLS